MLKSVLLICCVCLIGWNLAAQSSVQNEVNLDDVGTFDIHYMVCNWKVDPAVHFIEGKIGISFNWLDSADAMSFDLAGSMMVDSVLWHGKQMIFKHEHDKLILFLPHKSYAGQNDSLWIYYHGVPDGESSFGIFNTETHQGVPVMWTLSEPDGASEWFPCKNDLTDKIDSLDINVAVPAQYVVASNGVLTDTLVNGNEKIWCWKHRYPVATYLVAFAVTNYRIYNDYLVRDGDSLQIMNFVYPESYEKASQSTAIFVNALDFLCDKFGRYPFWDEKYGHAQVNWQGGMEHQTMTFAGRFDWGLLVHEAAHQWFGDMVTTGSWQHIWINEAFATYATALGYEYFSNDHYWPLWKKNVTERVTAEDDGSVFVHDTTRIDRIFSGRLSYYKAAYLLHMIRWIVGDDTFFSALQRYLYQSGYQWSFAVTDDLMGVFEQESGIRFDEFLNDWYYGEGFPVYKAQCSVVDGEIKEVTLWQNSSHPSVAFFEMPVPLLLKGREGDTTLVLHHHFSGEQFSVPEGIHADSLFIDPERWILSGNNEVVYSSLRPHRSVIRPMPFGDHFVLEQQRGVVKKVVLYNSLGSMVKSLDVWPVSQQVIDATDMGHGLYFIHLIYADGGTEYHKVIKY